MFLRPILLPLILVAALAACDSVEERVEKHYQAGVELAEEGDYARAIVEFRNALRLDDNHLQSRYAIANLYRDTGTDINRARKQYQRIVEQFPEELEARVSLAELSYQLGRFEDLDLHAAAAAEMAPDEPRVLAVNVTRLYRAAILDEDESERRTQAGRAEELLLTRSEDAMLRTISVDSSLRDGEFDAALAQLDRLIEQDPDDIGYWQQRVRILAQLEDFEALETSLLEMVERFDTAELQASLLRFYLSQNQPDKAEGFLRGKAQASEEVGPEVDLILFIRTLRGEEAAREELNAALARRPDDLSLQGLKASLDFDSGQREEAIELLETILEKLPSSEEEEDTATFDMRQNIRVVLAQMLVQMNNEVGARVQVEQVLADDPENVAALKLEAGWLIEADDTDSAITSLRLALERAPEDAEVMTLMAQAHQRAGSPDLAREFLALAVDASGNAPAETIRYAKSLIQQEQYRTAEDILLPALRISPENIELLRMLGQVYLETEDDARLEQVIVALNGLETPNADQIALQLEAEQINRKNGPEQAMAFLEGVLTESGDTATGKATLLRARLATGDLEGALVLSQEMLEEDPDNPGMQALNASVEVANGNLNTGEQIYRMLLDENAARANIWLELSRVKTLKGEQDQAQAVIDEGIAANPDNANLLWAKASFLERENDFEGAIGIYEAMYEEYPNSVVIANNLASLISTYRTDAENLEQAWTIARRLREADVPHFQDTYGWIAHRRGNSEEALPYLEAAAQGLPTDPIVQYHLAEVYTAVGRPEDALRFYRRSIQVAGPLDKRPQIGSARTRIEEIEKELSSAPASE